MTRTKLNSVEDKRSEQVKEANLEICRNRQMNRIRQMSRTKLYAEQDKRAEQE